MHDPVAGELAYSEGRPASSEPGPKTLLLPVLEVRDLSPSTYVLRLARGGLWVVPGQWINLGIPGSGARREYTIYSSPRDESIEVLIREIEIGTVSRALRRRRPGELLEVEGPHGSFAA